MASNIIEVDHPDGKQNPFPKFVLDLDNIVVPRKHWVLMQEQLSELQKSSSVGCKKELDELVEHCRDIELLNVFGENSGD